MLASQLASYLTHMSVERGLSPHTVSAYRSDLTKYKDFLITAGCTSLAEVTTDHVTEFVLHLGRGDDEGKVLAASSVNRATAAVKGWHRFAVTEGWTTTDPASSLGTRATARRLPKAL